MKILFVSKREPQQRDLIARPYGRFFHLPKLLSELGNEVQVLLISHKRAPETIIETEGLRFSTIDPSLGLLRLLDELDARTRAFQPNWIVGVSDTWYGWLAHRLAKRTGARLVVDAYDNYEAYIPWNLPLHLFWRRAISAADVVTAAGPQLAALMQKSRQSGQRAVDIVPMAADPMFIPHDRVAARASLGLPAEGVLIGYCGSWASNRGTDVLLEAFRRVRAACPDARLVMTGRPPAHALSEPGALALGYVDDCQLPLVLSSLSVACVITADTSFGRFSYPAKLCEAMACKVPVVATATEPVRWMLQDDTRFIAPIGNAHFITQRILDQLDIGRVAYPDVPTWKDSAKRFEAALKAS